MDLQKTGTIIYNARKKLNLTQNELGSILGVTGKAVSKWEKGYSFPDVGLLAPLSETLSVPVHSLVSGELDDVPSEKSTRDLVAISSTQSKRRKRLTVAITVPIAVILVAIIIITSIFLAFSAMPPSAVAADSFSVSSFGSNTVFTADLRCYVGTKESYGDCGSLVFTHKKKYVPLKHSIIKNAEKDGFSYDVRYSLLYKENENKTVDYFYVEKVDSYYKNVVLFATGMNAHLLAPSGSLSNEPIVACDFLLPLHLLSDKTLLTPYSFIPSYAEYRTQATSIEEICSFYEKTGYFTVITNEEKTSATAVSNSLCAVYSSFGFDYLVHSGSAYVRFFAI